MSGQRRDLVTHRRPWNIARLERPTVLLFVVGIFTIFGLLAAARFGIPLLAGPLAELTPPALTRVAGTGTLKSLDRIVLDPTELSQARRDRLTAGFDAIVRTNAIDGEPKLHFRRSKTIGPNAFALMGGHIVVTDELVNYLKDDTQVIAIIAHELAHAKHLHAEQKVWRVAGTGLILTLMFADAGTLVEELITLSYGVAELSNTREHEAEADRSAVEMLMKADMDPSALAEAMNAFKALFGGADEGGWLSTHPRPGRTHCGNLQSDTAGANGAGRLSLSAGSFLRQHLGNVPVLSGKIWPWLEICVYFAHGYSALCAGLRGGALTGRRAVALAAPLRRGCLRPLRDPAVVHRATSTISHQTKNNRATSEARPSGRRPVRGALAEARANGVEIAVSEINEIPKPRHDHAGQHRQHSAILHGTKNNRGDQRGKAKRPPPGQGAPAEARAKARNSRERIEPDL